MIEDDLVTTDKTPVTRAYLASSEYRYNHRFNLPKTIELFVAVRPKRAEKQG